MAEPLESARRAVWALFIVAVLVFVVCLPTIARYPTTGVWFDAVDGIVSDVEPPNAALIQPGDQVVQIDQVPFWLTSDTGNKPAGSSVAYQIVRVGSTQTVDLAVVPPMFPVLLDRVVLLLVGASFITLAALILLQRPARTTLLLAIWCILAGVAFVARPLVSERIPHTVAAMAYPVGIYMGAAAFLHFHTLFPNRRSGLAVLLLSAYGTALALTALFWHRIFVAGGAPQLLIARHLGTVLTLVALAGSAALLWQGWRSGDGMARRRLRLVVAGTFVAVLLVCLSVFVAVIFDQPHAYSFGVWSLLTIPVAYAIALHRRELFSADLRVHRLLISVTLILAFIAIYLAGTSLLLLLFPRAPSIAIGSLVSLGLGFLFVPLRDVIERTVNRTLYGGELQLREAADAHPP